MIEALAWPVVALTALFLFTWQFAKWREARYPSRKAPDQEMQERLKKVETQVSNVSLSMGLRSE